jgi:hippurate hydrolase
LASIRRIADGEAQAGGAPRQPEVVEYESTDSVYNNPALAQRLKGVLETALGKQNVIVEGSMMPSEDYSVFVEQGVPSLYFSLGGADPEKYAEAKRSGQTLPSNHSPLFAPDMDPSLRTGITAEVAILRNLFSSSAEDLHRLTANNEAGAE